ncbi:MAG: hypothetical protein ACXAD7_03820 [Candidatus Kariarchaeaceae archaeon]
MVETGFEKLKLEIQSIDKTLVDKLTKLTSGIDDINTEISTLKVSLDTINDKVASYRKNVQDQEAEQANLTKEHEELSRIHEEKNGIQSKQQEGLAEQESSKVNLEGEISKSEGIAKELRAKMETKEVEIKKVKKALLNAENIYEERVASIEREIDGLTTKIESQTNQYKVLRKLIQDGYIKDPHYDVCKVLKQPGVDTIDKLVFSSGVDKNTVNTTLEELSTRGAITIDKSSNTFSLTKEFEI